MSRLLAVCILCLGATVALAADAPLFPDAGLEAAVRARVLEKRDGQAPLTPDDVKYISDIDSSGKPIKSLAGLDHCPQLADLKIRHAELGDLEPLRGLTNMQSLTLSNNRIKDLSPLSGMPALQYLDLNDNQIANLAPLGRVTSLNTLYLANNRLSDLSPLASAAHLWSLDLAGNQISDLRPIGQLQWLSSLDVGRNKVRDLTPLAGLTNLRSLSLEGNPVSDLSPLVNMARKDAQGARQFAPFLTVYLSPGQGTAAQVDELRKYVHEVNVSSR